MMPKQAVADAGQLEKSWGSSCGLKCFAKRHPSMGHWCGYVSVPSGHRLHGKSYDEAYDAGHDISVHGGLTYAEDHAPMLPSDGSWWFGFDCAHAGDPVPSMRDHGDDVYRDLAFVEAECESLAKQLSELSE